VHFYNLLNKGLHVNVVFHVIRRIHVVIVTVVVLLAHLEIGDLWTNLKMFDFQDYCA
jgi:hypothetical protein